MRKIYAILVFCCFIYSQSFAKEETTLDPAIVITSLSATNFCPGQTGTISFTSSITTTTTYAVQISNFDGTFGSNPAVLGTGSSSPITFTLPSYSSGQISNIRLRIVNVQSPYQISSPSDIIKFNDFTATIQDAIGSTYSSFICTGSSVKLYAKLNVADNNDVAYEWTKSGFGVISGATSSTYITNQTGQYTVKATKAVCGVSNSPLYYIYPRTDLNTTSRGGFMNSPNIYQCAGSPIELYSVYNSENAVYQWKKDGIILSNTTSYSLNVSQSGDYSVRISDSNCNGFTTDTKKFVFGGVIPTALINGGKDTIAVCQGTGIVLSHTDTPNNAYSYQWRKDGENILGATASDYFAISGIYSLKVSRGNCSSNSKSIIVRNDQGPSNVIKIRGGNNICTGYQPTKLYLDNYLPCSGVSFQWQKNQVDISGATSIEYLPSQTGSYRLKFTKSNIITYSNIITISVGNTPTYELASLYDTTTCIPYGYYYLNSEFISSATYQWYKNGVVISNPVNTAIEATSYGKYKVRVSIGSCVGFSQEINLTQRNLAKPIIKSDNGKRVCNNTYTSLTTVELPSSTFIWKKNGISIPNNVTNSIPIAQSGNYTVSVTQGTCTAESDPIKISIGENQQSLKTADWSNAATWSCGTIPTIAEDVLINKSHTVSLPNGYTGFLKNMENNGSIIYGTNALLKFLQN